MNWVEEDIQISLGQPEYIDTAIIPLCMMSWGTDTTLHANNRKYISRLCKVLEKKYRGRMMLFPPYTYIEKNMLETQLISLEKQLIQRKMKYIFFLTCEMNIEIHNVLEVSPLPIHKMDYDNQTILLDSQVEVIMKRISEKWGK